MQLDSHHGTLVLISRPAALHNFHSIEGPVPHLLDVNNVNLNSAATGLDRTRHVPGTIPLGGSFTLTSADNTQVGPFPHDAPASEIAQALSAIGSIGGVTVSRTVLTHSTTYLVNFASYTGNYPSELVVGAGSLTGTNVGSAVNTVTQGTVPLGGTFTISTSAGTTGAINFDATARQVENALEAMDASTDFAVTRLGIVSDSSQKLEFTVSFPSLQGNVQDISVSGSSLTGSSASASVLPVTQGTYAALSAGTFALSLPSAGAGAPVATTGIPYNVGTSVLRTALLTLPLVNDVSVTSDAIDGGTAYHVTFVSYGTASQHAGGVPLLSVSSTSLTPATATVETFVKTPGYGPEVQLSLSSNGRDFETTPLTFTYYPLFMIDSVYPGHGSTSGGTRVQVDLLGTIDVNPFLFDASSNTSVAAARCRFGQAVVPAEILSSSSVACVAPAAVALSSGGGRVGVSLSANGVDFGDSDVAFEYTKRSSSITVFPTSGPVSGGTPVVVTGFVGTEQSNISVNEWRCKFGDAVVHAQNVTSSQIMCASPAVAYAYPRTVRVAISRNGGVDYNFGEAQFTYEEKPYIAQISPRSGPSTGGTLVSIYGGGFVNRSDTLRCRFGEQVVDAVWYSEGVLSCMAPYFRPQREVQQVTNNGGTAFRLGFGQVCTPIASGQSCSTAYSRQIPSAANASDIEIAIRDLPNIGVVHVSGMGPWMVSRTRWASKEWDEGQLGDDN